MKNFVKLLDKDGYNFINLQQRFPHIIDTKLRSKFIMDQQIMSYKVILI